MRTITIDGDAIDGIASFYAEINRVLMAGEGWTIGQNLDALNDLLHGGFGALASNEPVRLVWRDFEKSRTALGMEATKAWHRAKLERPTLYNAETARDALAALERGEGRTYFDIVLEIIAEHDTIELVPA
ncbi:barstar family protein [Pelagibacterium sp. H642]|uniref:barstar family protein n=1 Tax=Pelagibacterium sp. H642 TaxID=1881069 RepID=UPI0028161237|nr:barstar family protein [Pelagibacterium sp. H642]WMT92231.1 barstar family protein [Pelagibacterium sp. H642]